MATIGDDGEQDVVTGLRRPLTLLDRLDARFEDLLVGLEGGRLSIGVEC